MSRKVRSRHWLDVVVILNIFNLIFVVAVCLIKATNYYLPTVCRHPLVVHQDTSAIIAVYLHEVTFGFIKLKE